MADSLHDDNPGSVAVPDVTYGFIGIGNMGFGMAQNIRAKIPATSNLVICDLNQARVAEFLAKAGGNVKIAVSPREVAEQAEIILTSLPHSAAVETVFTDPDSGLLSIPKPAQPRVFLECSSINIGTVTAVLKHVEASGVGVILDTPVSGGIASAARGDLSIMVGGTPELFARVRPILEMIGKPENIFLCGLPGDGMATKLINNYCNFINYAVLCEAMNAGVRYGLNPKTLAEVMNVSSGMTFHTLKRNPVKGVHPSSPAERDFKPGFTLELAKGVMDMAMDLMDEVGAKQLFGSVMADVYERAVKSEKCAHKEHRSIWRLFSENEGRDLGIVVMEK